MTLSAEPDAGQPALSEAELRQALLREQRISRALREVGNALGATLDLDDLLELILGKLTDLVEADRATLYLLDDKNRELVSRLVIGEQVKSIRMKVGHGIAGIVAQTGRAIRVRDAYRDDRFEKDWDLLTGYRTTTMLVAPLKNHLGRTIGVIQVLNKKGGGEFTDEDEAILSVFSTQAAVAIDNSRLFLSLIQKNKQLLDTKEQLEVKVRDLELLFDLEQSTARAPTMEALVAPALSKVAQACGALAASVLVADEESGDLVQYTFEPQNPQLSRTGVKVGEGFLGVVFASGEEVLKSELSQGPPWSERIEGSFSFVPVCVLAVPLEGEKEVLGAIGLFGKEGSRDLDKEDAELLRLVAANLSTAIRLFYANAAREVEERLTSIGRLLSQVIHDFKTPMTVISGYVQLMQDEDDAQVRADHTEHILKQFDSLASMQREVLEFARGERTVFVRKVYLRKFFADLKSQLERELQGKPIELVLEIDSMAVARFDQGKIARAIFNLARNAVEAMTGQGGGKLTIFAALVTRSPDQQELVIAVSDTGPGIPEEIEGRLFQSFVTAQKKGGTGLGLAIVRKIVEEHGGIVAVQSSSQGARFELRLPQGGATSDSSLAPARSSKSAVQEARVSKKGSKPKRGPATKPK